MEREEVLRVGNIELLVEKFGLLKDEPYRAMVEVDRGAFVQSWGSSPEQAIQRVFSRYAEYVSGELVVKS